MLTNFWPVNYKSQDLIEKLASTYVYMHICLYHRNITKVVKQDLTGVSIRKKYYVCNEYSWFLPPFLLGLQRIQFLVFEYLDALTNEYQTVC